MGTLKRVIDGRRASLKQEKEKRKKKRKEKGWWASMNRVF
jgi:hypothetical protein